MSVLKTKTVIARGEFGRPEHRTGAFFPGVAATRADSSADAVKRRIKLRSIFLSLAGLLVGVLTTWALRATGYWEFSNEALGLLVGVLLLSYLGLWLILRFELDALFPWDPHFLYVPWATTVFLFSFFTLVLPEARVLVPLGFLVNVLFLVGVAGFWEVFTFSGLMCIGYLGAVLVVDHRGGDVEVGFEIIMAGLILVLGAYAGAVLERARRNKMRMLRLTAELSKLSLAVEQGSFLLIITDIDGRIEYVNPHFVKTTGYSLDEIVGKTPAVLKSGEASPEFYEEIWRTILSGEAWNGEFKNRKKNGEPYSVLASISPLRDDLGVITHFLGVQTDITRQKEIETQLAQAQKMEVVGQLVSGVAHDFNNLLTGVMGYSELALEQAGDNQSLREDLTEVRKAGESASMLTQQLLAFSRQQMLRPEILDLNAVLVSTENLLRQTVTEEIELVTTREPELGLARVDPAQIQQILLNLAVNARDAMPHGGQFRVETANTEVGREFVDEQVTVRPGRYVMLTVSDTGVGMTEQVRKRIFEPFFTTKELGRGTGLGLATVYGIVKQSGGYIWVDSQLGKGTEFRVFLPRVEGVAAELETVEAGPAPPRGVETILLVEDDKVVRTLAELVLTGAGYRVVMAENPAMAIARWKDGTIDLLVTDIVMPGMNGVDLADSFTSKQPGLKVLYMSGYAAQSVIENKLADPDTPFMSKPFKVADLLSKVREVLDSR